jgi:hypothetical protein
MMPRFNDCRYALYILETQRAANNKEKLHVALEGHDDDDDREEDEAKLEWFIIHRSIDRRREKWRDLDGEICMRGNGK